MNGWPRLLCWDTYLYPASGRADLVVTVFGRWTFTRSRPLPAAGGIVGCDCRRARPSERDLTGHRYRCPAHPALTRGAVVMSRASLAALSPGMVERISRNTDILIAEDLLAQLEEEETS